MIADQVAAGRFADPAGAYENLMERLVPKYRKQHEIISDLLPENTGQTLRVLDLGCGSGSRSALVLKKLPGAHVVGFDRTPKLIKAYEKNLAKYKDRYELMLGDYLIDSLGSNYDIILAGLSLQRLTWGERKEFYHHIHSILNPGGAFILKDIIIDLDWDKREAQYNNWMEFIATNGEDPEFWLERHRTTAYPVTLEDHFKWLAMAGFADMDCCWRFHNFAITRAVKKSEA